MVSQMDYPSTTQALFALIVMIIVLIFILVYCCWGTFACPKREEFSLQDDEREMTRSRRGFCTNRDNLSSRSLVILPYNNMVYIGDGETRRVYHFPMPRPERPNDKPPSYRDLFSSDSENAVCQRPLTEGENHDMSVELPPTYDECFQMYKNLNNSFNLEALIAEDNEELKNNSYDTSTGTLSQATIHIITPKKPISCVSEPVLSNLCNSFHSSNRSIGGTRLKAPQFFKKLSIFQKRSNLCQDVEAAQSFSSQSMRSIQPINELRTVTSFPIEMAKGSSGSLSYMSFTSNPSIADIPTSLVSDVLNAIPDLEISPTPNTPGYIESQSIGVSQNSCSNNPHSTVELNEDSISPRVSAQSLENDVSRPPNVNLEE